MSTPVLEPAPPARGAASAELGAISKELVAMSSIRRWSLRATARPDFAGSLRRVYERAEEYLEGLRAEGFTYDHTEPGRWGGVSSVWHGPHGRVAVVTLRPILTDKEH